MFRQLVISCFFISSISILAQTNSAVEQARDLIANQRYASAYEFLRGSDPNDQNPEIAIERTNLLLNYYIKTDKFHAFALKDLAPNQKIEDMRISKSTVKMLEYKPDSILNKLIVQYPDNYELRYALGNYFYEVHLAHSNDDSWFYPDSVVVESIRSNYLAAYDKGVSNYWSLFGIGYTYLINDDYEKAIPFLEESIKLNPDYPLSYYNLAYAYLAQKQPEKTIEVGKKAYDMQKIPTYKSETAILLAATYRELRNDEKALEYLQSANKLTPNNYNVLVPLLAVEVALDKPSHRERANQLYSLGQDNPIIYQDIMKAYSEAEREKEFVGFLESKRNEYRTNIPVSANIHLYMAISQYEIDDWVASKINFEKARSLFRNLYKNDHNVFKVIDSYTEAIKKKKK